MQRNCFKKRKNSNTNIFIILIVLILTRVLINQGKEILELKKHMIYSELCVKKSIHKMKVNKLNY